MLGEGSLTESTGGFHADQPPPQGYDDLRFGPELIEHPVLTKAHDRLPETTTDVLVNGLHLGMHF